MDSDIRQFLRALPRMDDLLELAWVRPLTIELGRETVKHIFDEVLTAVRRAVRDGEISPDASPQEAVESRAREWIARRARTSLRKVINATGVVVHTNLGRSPLPAEAVQAVADVASGYSTLEYSLSGGTRGQRNAHVEWLLCQATGAEAALVVNNNAGAVLLALAGLARDAEVVVSCGELVEIGGSFRIPEILSFSGARMRAVGCTNCTHLRDYRDALTEETAVLLKVHPSNYRIQGFTESVAREELAALAHEHGKLCMEDLGSGLLEDLGASALGREPTVRACIDAGVDVVTFSGDKLLGGPQIGCIAGRSGLIDRLRGHQLLRALRVDKMTLAAFETILRMYLKGHSDAIPTVAMLRRDADALCADARALCGMLTDRLAALSVRTLAAEVVETRDAVGGGSFPTESLPGWGVALYSTAGVKAEQLAARLRAADVPIVTGVRDNRIVFHVRTLQSGETEAVAAAVAGIFERA